MLCILLIRRPSNSTRSTTLFPHTPLFRSTDLAYHAISLLGASPATVIIECICSTVRVTRGSSASSIYANGSRMRLLEDNGMPCGSIAVSARADGRPYTQVPERMLEALADRKGVV